MNTLFQHVLYKNIKFYLFMNHVFTHKDSVILFSEVIPYSLIFNLMAKKYCAKHISFLCANIFYNHSKT